MPERGKRLGQIFYVNIAAAVIVGFCLPRGGTRRQTFRSEECEMKKGFYEHRPAAELMLESMRAAPETDLKKCVIVL